MTVNISKTAYLCVTLKKTPLKYIYNLTSLPLKQVTSYKYLGVTIANNLSVNLHIDNICSSACRKLCYLRHKLRNSPPNVKLLSYLHSFDLSLIIASLFGILVVSLTLRI